MLLFVYSRNQTVVYSRRRSSVSQAANALAFATDCIRRQLLSLDISSHGEHNSALPADVITERCHRPSPAVTGCQQAAAETFAARCRRSGRTTARSSSSPMSSITPVCLAGSVYHRPFSPASCPVAINVEWCLIRM